MPGPGESVCGSDGSETRSCWSRRAVPDRRTPWRSVVRPPRAYATARPTISFQVFPTLSATRRRRRFSGRSQWFCPRARPSPVSPSRQSNQLPTQTTTTTIPTIVKSSWPPANGFLVTEVGTCGRVNRPVYYGVWLPYIHDALAPSQLRRVTCSIRRGGTTFYTSGTSVTTNRDFQWDITDPDDVRAMKR